MSRHLAVKLLSSYLDEEVTTAQLRLVEGHLDECAECTRTLAGLRAVSEGVRRLEAVAPPNTLSSAVERRVRMASQERVGRWSLEDGLERWTGQPVLAPVFAIILALGAILYLFAFGVSRSDRHTTRFVVAAAPTDEGRESADMAREPAALGAERLDDAAPKAEPSNRTEPAPAADPNPQLAASSPRLPASSGPPAEEQATPTDELSAAVEVAEAVPPSVGDGARQAPAAALGAARSRAPASAREQERPAREGLEFREVGGRRFVAVGEIWIEVGLEKRAAAEVLEWSATPGGPDTDLAPFRELGRVRLEVDDRVLEVIYPDPERE